MVALRFEKQIKYYLSCRSSVFRPLDCSTVRIQKVLAVEQPTPVCGVTDAKCEDHLLTDASNPSRIINCCFIILFGLLFLVSTMIHVKFNFIKFSKVYNLQCNNVTRVSMYFEPIGGKTPSARCESNGRWSVDPKTFRCRRTIITTTSSM